MTQLKSLKKVVTAAIMGIIILCTTPMTALPAMAASATEMKLNKLTTGSLAYGHVSDTYKLTLNKPSFVKIDTVQEGTAGTRMSIISGLETIRQIQLNENLTTCSQVLNKGTYDVVIELISKPESSEDKNYSKYKFTTSVTPVNVDTEPNDAVKNAVDLPANTQIKGSLTYQDILDVYKIVNPSKSNVTITVVSEMYSISEQMDDTRTASVYYSLKNTKYDEIFSSQVSGSKAIPQSGNQSATLDKGTYYLFISRASETDVGNYSCKWTADALATGLTISGPKQIELNKTAKLTATVAPSNATDKAVEWSSSDSSIISVDETTGKIQANNYGTCTVSATLTSNNEITKNYKVTVIPPSIKLGTVTNKKGKIMFVNWKQKKNITGYQVQYSLKKNFSKNIKNKKVNQLFDENTEDVPKNKNSLTVKKLKKGKIYYVRIRPYYKDTYTNKTQYGSWSDIKHVKIKK